jgi:hypothetical protein
MHSLGPALVVAVALAAALPSHAAADVGRQIINRCGRGESLAGYTVKQYQQALKEMETEVIEYSNCAELISQAELAASQKHHGGSEGGGTTGSGAGTRGSPGGGTSAPVTPTPTEERELAQARRRANVPVQLGPGETVAPGVVHSNLASAASNLPTPVLIVIALVLAGLALLAGSEVKRRSARPPTS